MEPKEPEIEVLTRDDKGRELIILRDDQLIFCRYHDMSDEAKEYMEEVFKKTNTSSVEEFRKFLNFEEETDEFCS